jgi:peptidoglycan hydrolase-like protein with peptidoglycan-binding domain
MVLARKSRLGVAFDLIIMGNRANFIALFAVTIGLFVAASVSADDNVRAVQEKLRDGGFYSGEIDGAYSSQLAAALTRYQVRKGLAVTGQLDVDTSEALGAKPAVAASGASREESSETWRR